MIIKPVGKRVLIEKTEEEREKTTVSGIILSPTKKLDDTLEGRVVNLGYDYKENSSEIEIGDIVIYNQEGEVKIPNEKNLYIVNLESIYAVRKEN